MAKLGHPDGEINLTKGAASTGIIQVVRQTFPSLTCPVFCLQYVR